MHARVRPRRRRSARRRARTSARSRRLTTPSSRARTSSRATARAFDRRRRASLSDGERTFLTEVKSYELGVRYTDGARSPARSPASTRTSARTSCSTRTARNEQVPGTARRGLAAEITARGATFSCSRAADVHARRRSPRETTRASGAAISFPMCPPRSSHRRDDAKERSGACSRDLEGRIGTGLESLVGRPLPYGETGRNVFLVDASAALRLKEVELGLDVFNLFDANWYNGQFVYASNFSRAAAPPRVPFRHVTVGPPRTLFFTLTLHV